MIISASRRTDLPAFFPKQTIEKIISMNNDEQKTLFTSNKVEAVVFWTKNAEPIIPYLKDLDNLKIPYYFQYTMNDYREIEPNIPPFWKRLDTFIKLSKLIGKDRVIWRYDPFFTSTVPIEFTLPDVLRRFEFMGNCLYKYTDKLVFSFLDKYDKIPSGLNPPTPEEEIIIVDKILELNKIWKIRVATCAEVGHKVEINKCIDPFILMKMGVEIADPHKKDYSQRKECNCYPSTDIGVYRTCKHDCLYCYAK